MGMNDDVGTIDSDFDDKSGDVESDNKKNIPREGKTESTIQSSKETSKEIKPQIAGLPMEDASDAWMNDDVGTIDSDSDDESEDVKSDRKKNQPEESRTETEAEITIQISKEKIKEIKPQIAGLPMEDASDAWMNDDVGTIGSDSDDESGDV